jgi:hypothetical protein
VPIDKDANNHPYQLQLAIDEIWHCTARIRSPRTTWHLVPEEI